MDSSFENSTADSDPNTLERKGSVKRAREMLEAGRRARIQTNAGAPPHPANSVQMSQWPLLNDNGLQTSVVDSHARLPVSRGPPPPRPVRPDLPSPSIYSERSVSDATPSPLHINHPPPSFSLPIHPALREPAPAASDNIFRKSEASSLVSLPSIPDFPPMPPRKSGHLVPPAAMRSAGNRVSSVSPIPEELPDSPTIINKPYAPSQITTSTWSSERRESDILGNYLDVDSDSMNEYTRAVENPEGTLVRQASLGKRGKPSLRTISKPNVGSPLSVSNDGEKGTAQGFVTAAAMKEIAAGLKTRDSLSSISSEESHSDPEKPPIVLSKDPRPSLDHRVRDLEKEVGTLPKGTPTMSETRPGARRPPRLNMSVVREAEARGSLTSLSDLIKRATKLATNLEHGRTASRNDLLNMGGSRFPFRGDPNRRSGSIKDILASFPPPAATPEGHSSWPVFFRRSTLHQLDSQEHGPEGGQKKGTNRRRRCCGIPLWAFIVICTIIILIIAAAVLIPIFLVVVPRENDGNSALACEKSTPCENGGVSVSSGDVCSCVCANGYTGSRCTKAGDASCITTEITQGSTSRNATVGDDLPRLFEGSQSNFSIPLDSITIMALFSQNNVSCTTENALVSFNGVSSSNTKRRALPVDDFILAQLLTDDDDDDDDDDNGEEEPAAVPSYNPTPTLAARGSVATKNGIVFDSSPPSESSKAAEPTPSPTSSSLPTPTPSTISNEVLDFSRIAVLYILEKTGVLNAAMFSADNIQTYLEEYYSNSTETNGTHLINLVPAGVKGNFTLDFHEFTITNLDGDVIGAA